MLDKRIFVSKRNRGNTCRIKLVEMESELVVVEGHWCEHAAPRPIDCISGVNLASTESESFYRKSCVIISHMLDQLRNLLTIFVAKIV